MTSPHEEAADILNGILRELESPNRDLVSILRRGYHVSQLVNWQQERDWFYREMNGYADPESVPAYRQVHGSAVWRLKSSGLILTAQMAIAEELKAERRFAETPTVLNVFANADWLLAAAQRGYSEAAGKTKEYFSRRSGSVQVEQVRVFSAARFDQAVQHIENIVYAFASHGYTVLRYGNVLAEVWQSHRVLVEEC